MLKIRFRFPPRCHGPLAHRDRVAVCYRDKNWLSIVRLTLLSRDAQVNSTPATTRNTTPQLPPYPPPLPRNRRHAPVATDPYIPSHFTITPRDTATDPITGHLLGHTTSSRVHLQLAASILHFEPHNNKYSLHSAHCH